MILIIDDSLEFYDYFFKDSNVFTDQKLIKVHGKQNQIELISKINNSFTFAFNIEKSKTKNSNLNILDYYNDSSFWYIAIIKDKNIALNNLEKDLYNYIKNKSLTL